MRRGSWLPEQGAHTVPALASGGRKLTRRQWLIGASIPVALSACARRPGAPPPMVSIVRHAAYDQGLYEAVRGLLRDHKLDVRGKRVVLKPNLVEFDSATTINTHPLLVHAALEAFRALGAAEVAIAEGPGHRRITMDLAEAAGYFQTVPSFDGLFRDLNLDEITPVRLKHPVSRLRTVYFPNTALRADLLVSMPKLKTHHWVGATLSMKNLFGVVPGGKYGWPKNILHWRGIQQSIVDICATVPVHFVIADAIMAMEGNGPLAGTSRPLGSIVLSHDPVAADATCARLMGFDPERITHIHETAKFLGNASSELIDQLANPITPPKTPFQVVPEFEYLRAS
jgi:uncharacterized protein (DUF362 family)